MTDRQTTTTNLLTAALHSAGDVAQTRLGRRVTAGEGTLPGSNALLRFDVKFEDDAGLSWFVSNDDATGFSDLLIGGSGDRSAVLTEMHLDALSGVFSDMLERAIEHICSGLTLPIVSSGVDMGMEGSVPAVEAGGIRVVIGLDVEGFGVLTVVQHVSPRLATMIGERLADSATAPSDQHDSQQAHAASPGADVPYGHEQRPEDIDNVVELPNMGNRRQSPASGDIRMLLNVPLPVTVELGRTEQTIRELLELNVGSIIELAKLAGDPMDIMVNGRVLARGEVVVIDEEFGIRVTEICSPEDRLRNIG